MIRRVLYWMRSNPVTVGSAVLVLGCLIALFFIYRGKQAFLQEVAVQESTIRRMHVLERTTRQIPPEQPDQPERTVTIAVNPAAIDRLKQVFGEMSDQWGSIFSLAVQRNQDDHVPMVAGLFPHSNDSGKPYEAKTQYRNTLVAMLGRYTPNADGPRLDAGLPTPTDAIKEAMDKVQSDFLSQQLVPTTVDKLTDAEQHALQEKKMQTLMGLLTRTAQNIHLYAQTDISSDGFPFEVGAWSKPGPSPTWTELWEGQMDLWMQQDIAAAIAMANDTKNPQTSVLTAPIKQLLSIKIDPHYVGLNIQDNGSNNQPGAPALGPSGPMGAGSSAQAGSPSSAQPVHDDFADSPTGRITNQLYDVRHVEVTLVADARKLPELFNALSQVNFMTVVDVDLKDVDEYDALQQGYVFGSGDAVQVHLVIECIWLRRWTVPLMPPQVRRMLGVPTANNSGGADNNAAADNGQ